MCSLGVCVRRCACVCVHVRVCVHDMMEGGEGTKGFPSQKRGKEWYVEGYGIPTRKDT